MIDRMSGRKKLLDWREDVKGFESAGKEERNQCQSLLGLSSSNSLNLYNEALCNRVTFVENCSDVSSTLYIDNYGFPYYRSHRSAGRFQDAVLVKDIGVSCELLEAKPRVSAENYLVKRLRLEYNELSSITRKITAYTKDILQNLTLKDRRRQQDLRKMIGKKLVASEYLDGEGVPCLKLRLQDVLVSDAKDHVLPADSFPLFGKRDGATQKSSRSAIGEVGIQTGEPAKQRAKEYDVVKRDRGCQGILPDDRKDILSNSTTCSSSSIYNYLMTGKRKSSRKSETVLLESDSTNAFENASSSTQAENHVKKLEDVKHRDSVVITNWREISRAERKKKETTSAVNCPSKSRQKVRHF